MTAQMWRQRLCDPKSVRGRLGRASSGVRRTHLGRKGNNVGLHQDPEVSLCLWRGITGVTRNSCGYFRVREAPESRSCNAGSHYGSIRRNSRDFGNRRKLHHSILWDVRALVYRSALHAKDYLPRTKLDYNSVVQYQRARRGACESKALGWHPSINSSLWIQRVFKVHVVCSASVGLVQIGRDFPRIVVRPPVRKMAALFHQLLICLKGSNKDLIRNTNSKKKLLTLADKTIIKSKSVFECSKLV